MRKLLIQFGMIAGITIALSGCYPGGAEYTSDTDLVFTDHNPDYNYKSIQTYYLSDSINHIVEEGKTPDRNMDSYIISELKRNFDALGWTRLDSNDINQPEPDVWIVLSIIKVKNYNVYSGYPWYGGWGWGWYWKSTNYWGYPGYGWGYPWYGPSYVTSYETGTLIWDMFDPDNVDQENEVINVEWTGAINGVLGSSVSSTQDRISKGVDQAFRQSSYLQGE